MSTNIKIDDEKETESSQLVLGKKLYDDDNLDRHTIVHQDKVAILNVLKEMGEKQDRYRKHFNMTGDSVLSGLIKGNLRLRTSINGWRANQTVQILSTLPSNDRQSPSNDTLIIPNQKRN